ncbi:MAG: hypothetical protein JO199_11835, partial [Candidatus Eremiobacteraeota bacterium]|nr:hypothetical protein [Candidatus Eremiobacteraeota bacterium]
LAALDVDDDEALFPVLVAVGSLAWRAGDFRFSLSAGERALEIAERSGDPSALAQAQYITGWARFKLADEQRGLRELENAVRTFAAQGQRLNALLASIDYAIALKRTDPQRGHQLLREASETAGASGWPRTVARVEIGLGEYEFLTGNYAGACERARRIVEARKTVRSGYSITVALGNLSSYLNLMGETSEARRTALEAIELARTHGLRDAVGWSMQNVALAMAREGRYEQAARFLGSVDGLVAETGAMREPTEARVHQALLDVLREHLGEECLEQELRLGRSISIEDAAASLRLNEELIGAAD